MTGGSGIVIELGRRSAWLRGRGVHVLLEQLGAIRMWCPREGCTTTSLATADDVLALAELRGIKRVVVTAVDR